MLVDNREVLDRLARELIVHETLEAERVQDLFADVHMWEVGDVTSADASARPEGATPRRVATTRPRRRSPTASAAPGGSA